MKNIFTTIKENRRKDKSFHNIKTIIKVTTNENLVVVNNYISLLNIYKIANNINYNNNPIGA